MKIDIIEEKENKNLERKEVKAKITEFDKTPSRKEILKMISANIGADENKIIIDNIKQEFGKKTAMAYVKIYKNMEAIKKYEKEYKVIRSHGKQEESKKQEEGESK